MNHSRLALQWLALQWLALQWLYYQEDQIPKQGASEDRIRHVRNRGGQTVRTIVDSYFVDGYDPLTRTVYEFRGCPRCYPNRRAKHYVAPDRSVDELYLATLAKRMALLQAGYTVIELWECEWDRLVDTDEAVQRFLGSFDLFPPLEPRDAFFGGRTGAVALHAVAGENEEIRYVDVTSLYPWVNKNCLCPIGHPHLITEPVDQSILSFFGIALVDILPSRQPISAGLTPCAVAKNSPFLSAVAASRRSRPNPCWLGPIIVITRTQIACYVGLGAPSSWSKRTMVKAVEKSYTIVKIHEVWHFPPEQRRTGLFADYVNTWLKVKQESSGWPSWCKSVDQKREYILRYQEREGIRLDIASICQKSQTQGHGQADAKQFLG